MEKSKDSLSVPDEETNDGLTVDELVLQSCCHGLGIGERHDPIEALKHCIKAGMQGDVAAELTSIMLYDVLSSDSDMTLNLTDNHVQSVCKWRAGGLELPKGRDKTSDETDIGPCSLTSHYLFKSTPAARLAMQKYPSLSTAIKRCLCASSNAAAAIPAISRICGWSLLSNLQQEFCQVSQDEAWLNEYGSVHASNIQKAAEFRDPNGNTLLHFIAVSTGLDESIQLRLADLLISYTENHLQSICNQEGDSVLRLACYAGNWKLAISMRRAEMDQKALREICLEAIAGASWETLDELLRVTDGTEQAPNIEELLLSLCAVPLFQREMTSVDRPTDKGLRVLVKYGARVRCNDQQNRTTLALAVRAGNTDYVEFILKYLGCLSSTGSTVSESMEIDIESGLRQETDFLNRQAVDGDTALSGAIRSGNKKVVRWLLDLNVDVEWSNVAPASSDQRISALLTAYQALRYLKNEEIIQLIQSRYPDALFRIDHRGRSILHYLAAGDNEADTIICLQKALDSGLSALINAQDDQGFTPLHVAVVGGVAKNVEFLLNYGSDPTIADSRGYTVLHLAVEDYGQDDYPVFNEFFKGDPTATTAELLDSKDLWGRTALMHAAGKFVPPENWDLRGTAALFLLLDKANPISLQIRDTYGQTALHHFYGRCASLEAEGKDLKSQDFQSRIH